MKSHNSGSVSLRIPFEAAERAGKTTGEAIAVEEEAADEATAVEEVVDNAVMRDTRDSSPSSPKPFGVDSVPD